MTKLESRLTEEWAGKHFLVTAQFDRPLTTISFESQKTLPKAEALAARLLLDPKCIAITIHEVTSSKTIVHAYWPEENLPT